MPKIILITYKLDCSWMNSRQCSRMDKMSDSVQNSITGLNLAYRLMLHMKAIEAKKKGDVKAEKAAKDELDKDNVEISGAAKAASASSIQAQPESDEMNVSILLSDLKRFFASAEVKSGNENQVQQTQIVTIQQTIETQASLTYYSLEPVTGLVVRNRNLAETDRYRFEFQNGTTLKITDKWSNRSTTIWGDPHIDTCDEEGSNNGDFKDLKNSDRFTTFMLSDGTRVTFTAEDAGIIEQVDIFKGSQHLIGIGAASSSWSEDNGLFEERVRNDATMASSSVPMGDVVYAGGDGNDWFDANKNLIWGKTTGLIVTSRPSSFLQLEYYQNVTQQVTVSSFSQQA